LKEIADYNALREERDALFRELKELRERVSIISERENLLAAMISALPDICFVLDWEGRYLDILTRESVLLYREAETLQGQRLHEILPRDVADGALAAVRKTIESGRPHVFDYILEVPAGKLWFEGRTALLSPGAETIERNGAKVIFLARDITERKKAESELQRVRKLQSLSLLAGGVAHDFNNIVAGVLGNISVARLFSSETEVQDQLAMAEKGLLQSRELTGQLLFMARERASAKRLVHPMQIIEETLEYALSGTETVCRIIPFPQIPLINAEPGQIRRVIQNLVLNASQAMNGSGEILIVVRRFRSEHLQGETLADCENSDFVRAFNPELLSLDSDMIGHLTTADSEFVVVSVIDRGHGIPNELMNSLFEPYFTTREKGTGLGLVTCNTVMNRHGGFLKVVSKPSNGSAFHLFFPVSDCIEKGSEDEAEKSNEDVSMLDTARIIVIDDELTVARVLARLLGKLGFSVSIMNPLKQNLEMFAATDQSEAKDQNRTDIPGGQSFDIAFVDYQMPGEMDGHRFFRELKNFFPNIKGVLVTGYASTAVMDQRDRDTLRGDFHALLDKPFTVDELIAVLTHLGMKIPENIVAHGNNSKTGQQKSGQPQFMSMGYGL
jgi:signal transduction histidine kinase/CheY-like chemotaxis protein